MKKEAKQEIRKALLGRVAPSDDGRLVVAGLRQAMPLGVMDGAIGVRFLGICKKSRALKVSCPPEKARRIAFSVLQDQGRVLYLDQQPQVAACLIRYVLTRPVVLIFDYQEERPVLTAWTGRGLGSWISLRRALKGFQNRMPKAFELSDEPLPADREKAEAKARARQRRLEKKAQRKSKKAKQDGAKPPASGASQ